MIRPMTLLSMLAAAGAGLYLYQVKHSVAQLDRELRSVHRQTEQARERTQVLRAEWALLNEPERLRQVAQAHLPLEAMSPTQFVRMHEIERRLPAARVFAGPASLFAPIEPPGDGRPVALALAEPRGSAPAAPAAAETVAPELTAAQAVPAPVVVAAAAAAAAAPARETAAEPPVRPQQAARAAPPRPARPTAEAAPPMRAALHVARPAAAQPVQRVSAPPPAPQIASVLATGGPALAPPVPIARAAAATLSGGAR